MATFCGRDIVSSLVAMLDKLLAALRKQNVAKGMLVIVCVVTLLVALRKHNVAQGMLVTVCVVTVVTLLAALRKENVAQGMLVTVCVATLLADLRKENVAQGMLVTVCVVTLLAARNVGHRVCSYTFSCSEERERCSGNVGHRMYSLLCVISQYQEYKAGRGTAADDFFGRVPPVRYANRPTATSCLSTRKAVTYHETRATPTQSPTAPHSTVLGDDSGVSQRSGSSRKHVQFPDTATAIDDEGSGEAGAGAVVVVMEEPWTKGAKTPRLLCPSVDLAPLINPEPPSILLHSVKQIK
uniref:(California timema) hypothetical protein n=1 Tax=Timema californicum TaxID=61474 RepID=A0A7R9J9A5_TIMCA|nr:unnamed protein product [Timema californicum]